MAGKSTDAKMLTGILQPSSAACPRSPGYSRGGSAGPRQLAPHIASASCARVSASQLCIHLPVIDSCLIGGIYGLGSVRLTSASHILAKVLMIGKTMLDRRRPSCRHRRTRCAARIAAA
jgi:ABC-type uncharacterized transport system ATPase subunit